MNLNSNNYICTTIIKNGLNITTQMIVSKINKLHQRGEYERIKILIMMWLVSQFMICQTILSLTTNQTYLWSADTMISKYMEQLHPHISFRFIKTLFSKFLNESKSTKIKTSWSSILTFKANLCLQVKMHACMWLYISIIMCPHVCMCV